MAFLALFLAASSSSKIMGSKPRRLELFKKKPGRNVRTADIEIRVFSCIWIEKKSLNLVPNSHWESSCTLLPANL